MKISVALSGCGSRGRQRTVLNRICVRNLEANGEEIKESEGTNKETKERQRQDKMSRKDWNIMWTTERIQKKQKKGR